VGSAASALRAVAAVSVQGSDNQKGPDDVESSSPIPRFDTGKLVASFESRRTVPLPFPNITHGFWDNYRLTKEYYVQPAKP